MQLSSKIPQEYKNKLLIDYLVGRFTYRDRAGWQERIDEERFTYEGEPATAETMLKQNGLLVYQVPPFPQPEVNFNYSIVYEDEWLVAVNKPDNLRVHGEGKYMMANLLYNMREVREPAYPTVNTVHRLDEDTSGVVIMAKSKEAAREMGFLFQRREITKQYTAITRGIPEPSNGAIDVAIGKIKYPKDDRYGRVPRSGPEAEKLKPSTTKYNVLETFSLQQLSTMVDSLMCKAETEEYALVELHPITGRTHQLRVHLAHIGCPIIGDRLYTLTNRDFVEWREDRDSSLYADWMQRHALHCSQMSFIHPFTQEECVISAPLQVDMQAVLEQWRNK